MKPVPFDYVAPSTLDEALAVLAENGGDAKLLAGGQSLVPLMNRRIVRPAILVDINNVTGLDVIAADDGLVLGALARQLAVERSDDVAAAAPVLVDAIRTVAHPPIRARGTVVGSLAHGDPGAQIATVAVVSDAEIVVRTARGQRVLDAESLSAGAYATVLAPDEMIVEVRIPALQAGTGWAYQQVTRRFGHSPMVSVAALVRLAGGRIADARVAIGGAGDSPVRARIAETALVDAVPSDETFAAAAADAVGELDCRTDLHASAEYRRHTAAVLMRRALAAAARRA